MCGAEQRVKSEELLFLFLTNVMHSESSTNRSVYDVSFEI